MKQQNIVFGTIGLFLGFVIGYTIQTKKLEELRITIDNARNASVVLNKHYNQLYNKISGIALFEENDYGIVCFQILQKLIPDIKQVSKDLGLDCKQYNEDGTPLMIEKEDGQTYPIDGLPEEIKLTEE